MQERCDPRHRVREVLRECWKWRLPDDDKQGNLMALDGGELVAHIPNAAVVRYGDAAFFADVLKPLFVATGGRKQVVMALYLQARRHEHPRKALT
jgi:hypothetical protein